MVCWLLTSRLTYSLSMCHPGILPKLPGSHTTGIWAMGMSFVYLGGFSCQTFLRCYPIMHIASVHIHSDVDMCLSFTGNLSLDETHLCTIVTKYLVTTLWDWESGQVVNTQELVGNSLKIYRFWVSMKCVGRSEFLCNSSILFEPLFIYECNTACTVCALMWLRRKKKWCVLVVNADKIRSIKLNGPASYFVDQNISLTILVGGRFAVCFFSLLF